MCGIFVSYGKISEKNLKYYLKKITLRGKDTFGVTHINSKNPRTYYYSYENINFNECSSIKDQKTNSLIIANSRLITNGTNQLNTQPLINNEMSLVHNGIILNYTNLDFNSIELDQLNKSDSQLLFEKIIQLLKIDNYQIEIEKYLNSLSGEINLVFYENFKNKLFYYTNSGSLYLQNTNGNIILTSEEKFFLKKENQSINQISLNKLFDFSIMDNFKINDSKNYKKIINHFKSNNEINDDLFNKVFQKVNSKLSKIKRCTKCLVPTSYPKIKFDNDGVCLFCKQNIYGKEEKSNIDFLKKKISNNSKKCLVGLSGGFDSCYTLYFVKEVLKLEPIAFTYDWGLTTDVARINQSIMCQKLNVEHIIRTDNMSQKRGYIKDNIEAWFRKPHPGLIPLFMAGDKKYLHYERILKNQLNIEYSFFGNGLQNENRPFYWLYAGAKLEGSIDNGVMSGLNLETKLRLLAFFGINFFKNPKLLNRSLINSAFAYYYSFFENYDYISLFKYLEISDNEKKKFLLNEFGLKIDKKYGQETWRMGDGQSSFNNLLYSVLCGFTEIDDQLSCSIRNNEITRKNAFDRMLNHNLPKKNMLQYFFDLIGLDSNKILKKIFELDDFNIRS
jgi:glutamine---fructose-6-phosphate transaminase (isomerizing)